MMDFEFDYGPDSEREIELKKMLDELQRRYHAEAQPIVDELVRHHSFKVPKMLVSAEDITGLSEKLRKD